MPGTGLPEFFLNIWLLLCLFVKGMCSTSGTIFLKLQAIRVGSFIFCCSIVSFLTISAGQNYFNTHQTALLYLAATIKFNLPQFINNVNENNSTPKTEVGPGLRPGPALKREQGLPYGEPSLFTSLQQFFIQNNIINFCFRPVQVHVVPAKTGASAPVFPAPAKLLRNPDN